MKDKILSLRAAIRHHRDQKGDDRCWLDDHVLWGLVEPKAGLPSAPPPFDEAMEKCRDFYNLRRADTADVFPVDAVTDAALWDSDIEKMDAERLEKELLRLQNIIRMHHGRAAKGPLTIADDRWLYSILPEKVPADFRLPPEGAFLGEDKAPRAGCPSFWRSHQDCAVAHHKMDGWGPCGE